MRRATQADVGLLRAWETADHVAPVIGTGPGWEWENEVCVDWQEVWIAEALLPRDASPVGSPIGVVIVLDACADPVHYWGDVSPGTFAIDIWIGTVEMLRRGFGTEMMRFAIARAFDVHHAKTILIDPLESNRDAIAFYRSLGFLEQGVQRFDDDSCQVMALTR